MKTSGMARMKNGLKLAFLRMIIGRAWWLPLLFLLAAALTVKAANYGDFTYTTNPDNTISITGYTGPGGAVVIPATIEGRDVVSVGYGAFYRCAGLTGVTIPSGIAIIEEYAFSTCSNLTSVTIGNSVTIIGNYAFSSCSSLAGLTIPNSVTRIGYQSFSSCTGLASVTIGNGLASIGDYAFSACSNLTGLYFRGNAPGVGSGAFDGDNSATIYYVAGTTGWGATFGGRPTELWNPPTPTNPPGPTIKANGATNEIAVNYPGTVSVTVELNADIYEGTEVDWWIVAFAHSGEWYYLNNSMQWPSFSGDLAFCQPVHQGALFNLSSTTVLDRYPLPRGTYDFWFAIDYPMDGILNPNGQILFDKVTVVVQ